MSEIKVIQQIRALRDIATTPEILETAKKYGIQVISKHIPANEKEAYTLPEAAQVYKIDYEALRIQVNKGLIPTFRPLSRRGTPGRRRIRRIDMENFIRQFEE